MFYIGDNSGAALHLASSTGQVAVVDRLLRAQADVNRRQEAGATPLFLAAEFGHANVAKLLLQNGANADLPRWDSGDAPLHIACDKGHTAVVDRLIAAGADLNPVQEAGCTPIYMAAQNGHSKIVARLLRAGVDLDWRCLTNGNSALLAATQEGHARVVASLIQAAANVNLTNKKGETALHFAAQNGQLKITQLLLKSRADANVKASNGCEPIHTAAQNGNLAIVQALIAAQADVNTVEVDGASPVYIASQNGHQRVIKTLIESQANIDHQRNDGVSTIYIAAQEGHSEVARLLVRSGAAKVDAQTRTGETPLHITAQRGDQATLYELLQAAQGSPVNSKQNDGCSPIFLAAQFGHWKAIERLIHAGADVNTTRATTGQTPLHAAAENGHPEATKSLLRCFADVTATDRDGQTPLDLARKFKHKTVAELLEKALSDRDNSEDAGTVQDEPMPSQVDKSSSSLSEEEFSQQLHSSLQQAGFEQTRAALQSSCADVLQRILRQRLRSEEVFVVGSYSEGWGNSLSHLDGRTDPESDIDVMQLIPGRIYHLKDVCRCTDPDSELVVEYDNGHIICEGYASSPARPENGSTLRPAVDRVSACRLCCYPPIGPLQPHRLAKSSIPQPVLQSLTSELEASPCHVVHAAPPGQAGKQLRVSTTFLERRLLRSLTTLQGQLFVTLKFLVKKVIGRRVHGLKAYHAKDGHVPNA
uniref:ANK_REP_REGION domain-containing protein n=1 Tax=Macrostomum lignano TaxID=282301 RepID=A0A1I8JCA3_9PLAT